MAVFHSLTRIKYLSLQKYFFDISYYFKRLAPGPQLYRIIGSLRYYSPNSIAYYLNSGSKKAQNTTFSAVIL